VYATINTLTNQWLELVININEHVMSVDVQTALNKFCRECAFPLKKRTLLRLWMHTIWSNVCMP